MKNVSDGNCRVNQTTNFFSTFFSENHAICKIMWKNISAERGRPQMTQYGASTLRAGYLSYTHTHTHIHTHTHTQKKHTLHTHTNTRTRARTHTHTWPVTKGWTYLYRITNNFINTALLHISLTNVKSKNSNCLLQTCHLQIFHIEITQSMYV
jgi:hypothetical protein